MAAAATAMIDPACRAHGKFAGAGFVTDETLLRRYISMGARLILPGSDLNMMIVPRPRPLGNAHLPLTSRRPG
jgi:2-keto-3-deoxy-L-rhamnonate aldolase RhmA